MKQGPRFLSVGLRSNEFSDRKPFSASISGGVVAGWFLENFGRRRTNSLAKSGHVCGGGSQVEGGRRRCHLSVFPEDEEEKSEVCSSVERTSCDLKLWYSFDEKGAVEGAKSKPLPMKVLNAGGISGVVPSVWKGFRPGKIPAARRSVRGILNFFGGRFLWWALCFLFLWCCLG